MARIEKVVTVSYIKELVEKQAKTHREVSGILRQRYPGGGRNRIGRREKWPKKSWEEGEIKGKSREEGEKET